MKARTYWESLNSDERRALADSLDMTLNYIGKVLRGDQFVSIPKGIEITEACDNMFDVAEIVSPKNRKALKQLGKV